MLLRLPEEHNPKMSTLVALNNLRVNADWQITYAWLCSERDRLTQSLVVQNDEEIRGAIKALRDLIEFVEKAQSDLEQARRFQGV